MSMAGEVRLLLVSIFVFSWVLSGRAVADTETGADRAGFPAEAMERTKPGDDVSSGAVTAQTVSAASCGRLAPGNPYGIAGYISSAGLASRGFPPGLHTYDWNNLRTDLLFQMVRPFHYWYRYMVPGGNYVQAWIEYDAASQPEAWFTQQSYPTETPWNVRQGFNMMLRRYWGYFLDRAGGNSQGQIGLPADWLPQWYVDQGGNHQQRFDAWITANPGRIWLMGNEPGCFEHVWQLRGQDALTDMEYAIFYRTYQAHIRTLDPGSTFANAALAMTTSPTWSPELPVEIVIEKWERVLGNYADLYEQEMPVDVWNIHLYAGHVSDDPVVHREKYVQTIQAFRDFVDSARGGIYDGVPLILTEFNGAYGPYTRENVVSFLNDFRDDLNDLWVRGVLDHWFWFVSNGGTTWPAETILEGGNLTIVGEAYRAAAWHWEELKPPIHERYGTSGQPFHSENGGLWSSFTWSEGPGDNSLSVDEGYADRVRLTADPGPGTAGEITLADQGHLGGLGTFSFLTGQGAGIQLGFSAAGAADSDLFLGYRYGEGGPDDGQSGILLRAEGGDASNTTILDAFAGNTLATGIDFEHRNKIFFVVNASREMDLYLDDTAVPLATLSRSSLPDCDTSQLQVGSNSAQVAGQGRFRGTVDIFACAVDDDILQVDLAQSPPEILEAGLSANNLLANDLAVYTVSITAIDHDGVDQVRDVRVIPHDDSSLSPEDGRGYLAWGETDADLTHLGGEWTIAGDADGGGRWGWRSDDWGADQYLTPLSASTSVSGKRRTVSFTFRAKPVWATAHRQRLYASARDHLDMTADWSLSQNRFAVLRIDYDSDGDVDQEDFGYFQRCFSGPGIPQDDPACRHALLDDDSDVDAEDLAIFMRCFTAPNIPAAPDCAD